MHLKNVRRAAMEKCYAEGKSFLRSIPEGVFTVPGDPEGCVDFETVFQLLDTYHYEGWLVVEAEQGRPRPIRSTTPAWRATMSASTPACKTASKFFEL